MKARQILILLSCISIYSCNKNPYAIYEGYVYSKHHYPMPNLKLAFEYSEGGRSQGGIFETTTDAVGHFNLKSHLRRNQVVREVVIYCDSGSCNQSAGSNNTEMEIILK